MKKIISNAALTIACFSLTSCTNTDNTKKDAVKEKISCTDVMYSGLHGNIHTITKYTYALKDNQTPDNIPQDSSGLESIETFIFNEDGSFNSSESYNVKSNKHYLDTKTVVEMINGERLLINHDKDENIISRILFGTINDTVYNSTIMDKNNKIQMRIFNKIKNCNIHNTTTEIYDSKTERKESSIISNISFDKNGNMILNEIQAYDENGNEVAGMKMKRTYDILETDKYNNPVKTLLTGTSPMEKDVLRNVEISKITYY